MKAFKMGAVALAMAAVAGVAAPAYAVEIPADVYASADHLKKLPCSEYKRDPMNKTWSDVYTHASATWSGLYQIGGKRELNEVEKASVDLLSRAMADRALECKVVKADAWSSMVGSAEGSSNSSDYFVKTGLSS